MKPRNSTPPSVAEQFGTPPSPNNSRTRSKGTLLLDFDALPDSAYVRIRTVKQLYGGVSDATVWRNSGKSIPAPCKLSERVTAWSVRLLREDLAKKQANASALPSDSETTPPTQLPLTGQLDQGNRIPTARNNKVQGGKS